MHYSQRDFFHTVLSSEGKPCLAKLVKGSRKPYFSHETFNSIEDFCSALDDTDFTLNNYYFCISTLAEDSVSETKPDGTVVNRVRVQTNALKTRCFVLDVDVRPDKAGHYKTKEEGLQGVQQVVEALNLPQPIIVDSGFGLHVYWPMAEGIPSDVWRRTAIKFRNAISVIAPEVVADGSRVADTAGVLRIPNSFNLKNDKLTPVEIVQWYSDVVDFGQLEELLNRVAGGPTAKPLVNLKATVTEQKPGEFSRIAKNCNWMTQYLKNRNEASEPEWYAVLGLVPYMVHTKDSKKVADAALAHAISKGHPQYDEQATYNKYIQAKNQQTGPTTCARLQSINSSRCNGCPFATTVKTPIGTAELSRPMEVETTVEAFTKDSKGNNQLETIIIPPPPKPYFRGEDGGVFVRVKQQQADGTWDEVISKVYDYDMYPVRRYRTETIESEYMEVYLWLPKDGLRKFKLPASHLADGKTLAKFITDKGVIPEFGKLNILAKYLIDYVRHMQTTQAAEVEFSRFGWRGLYTTDPKFVIGDGFITKDGKIQPSSHADFLAKASQAVSTAGTMEAWKQGFNLYNHIPDSEAFILAALVGFAAPLLTFTPYSGVLYNLVGHSSAGKSTAMEVMTSVFGRPTATHILPNDTEISTFNFIGYLNNVPVAYDELTNLDNEKLSNFCLNFTTGRGKMRADRHGQNMLNSVEWDTVVVSSSNTSLYDKLAANRKGYNAEAMRIFELSVGASSPKYKHAVDNHMALLKNNYGHAGREFAKYVLANVPKIKELVERATVMVTTQGKLRNEERFWGALLACVLVGGKISRDVLKLHTYDVEGTVRWALGLSSKVRSNVTATTSDAISTLAEFFNSNISCILRMTEDNKPHLATAQTTMHSIKARIEMEADVPIRAFISMPAIREYCAQRRIDPSWLRTELIAEGIVMETIQQKRLTAGTKLPKVNVRSWEVNMQHPKLIDNLELPLEPVEPTTEE